MLLTTTGCQRDLPQEVPLVEIPDSAFLGGLVAAGADVDGDGQISYREAESTGSLVLPPSGITDLTGIEAFVNLDSLTITLNPLNRLDLSKNTSLRYLSCTSCGLTGLDLSANRDLEYLDCGRNLLEELDVTRNLSLVTLVCNNNLLTSLDISANTELTKMISCGNRLGFLDISRNTGLKLVGFDNMPMLTEVCVWILPFPPPGVTTLQEFSPNVVFTVCTR
jgi:Leucine-rich repeat (LRR) protein